MAGNINVNILSAFNDKGVKDAVDSLRKMGNGISDIGKKLVGGFGAFQLFNKGVSFIRDSVDASRDLQRNLTGLQTIFGSAAMEMQKFSEAGVSMGMSTAEAAKATTFLGSVMKQSGFAMEDNIVFTKKLVGLGADLAATYGYDVQEALTGMTALFRGEYDPIEKFGVAIKQAQVNAEMAAMGLNKLTGQNKLHAQQLIRMKLLFAATADAQGAFARNSDTLFVSQQRLAATFTDMQAKLGKSMIKPITILVQLMAGLTFTIGPSLEKLFMALGGAIGIVGLNASSAAGEITKIIDQITLLIVMATPVFNMLIDLISNFGASIITSLIVFKFLHTTIVGIGKAVVAFRAIMLAMSVAQAATTTTAVALTAAQTAAGAAAVASGAAVAATPWGAIAIAVAALVSGLVVLGGAFLQSMDKAKPAGESLSDFQARVDKTGNVSAYGTAVFSLSNEFDTLSDSARKAIAATTVFENLTKRDNTDIFTRNQSNKRKKYATKTPDSGLTETERALKDFKKLMKELGLLGGDGSGATGAAAEKVAKAIASPFAQMVTRIQGEMTKLRDAIISTFDITNMGNSGGSISRNIDKFMVKLREFSGYIAQLRAGGLNGDLLSQLAMAGPEKGLAAAKAFAGSPELVSQANAAYGELGTTATAIAGNVVQAKAAPVYNINVNAGVGDKKTIGMAVVEAIKSFERDNGKGWRS